MRNIVLFTWFLVTVAVSTACRTSYETSPANIAALGLDAEQPGIQDRIFVREALVKGVKEMAISRLGLQRSENVDLRLLSQRIYDDHAEANKELRIIALQEEIPLPTETSTPNLEHLDEFTGAEFDRLYLDHLVETHRNDIKKFEAAARSARNPEIRAFAARVLPALEEHRRIAENIGKVAGLGEEIDEPAGAERPGGAKPFYEGGTQRRHQFELEQ